MNRHLRNAVITAAVCLAAFLSSILQAATVTWNITTGTWDTTSDNWLGGSPNPTKYVDGGVDAAVFDSTSGGTVTIQATGVTPLSTTVSAASGTYTLDGGNLGGNGTLTKSGAGTLAVGQAYTGLDSTGNTQIDGGVLQIAHNSGGGAPSDRSLGGTTVLSGGTLRFQHTGAGHYNPTITFTSGITVDADGGTIDFSGSSNSLENTLSAPTLGGNLTVTGVTGTPNGNGATYNFTSGTVTLTTDATITNNTTKPSGAAHAIALSPNISGTAYTLNLASAGSGGGFVISNATATSINLASLNVGAGSSLYLRSSNGVNPLSQVKANGGVLTMGVGSTLAFQGTNASNGPVYDTTAVSWLGGGTLTIAQDTGGNRDTFVRISNGNLTVSAASGLTQFNAMPWRAYYTVDSPNAIVIGDGGTMQYTVGSQVRETLRGNLTLLNGATIVGVNSSGNPGGIIRDTTAGGTLTLGDGSASTVTVQGNHGADTDSFNLGFANNITDNGNVTMKYANTNAAAGNYFNIGWSNGGSEFSAPLVAFKETSGGTEFAPLAGSGGVAVVGASTGPVATFAKPATLTTAGTVGFYNEINTNQRGALGAVVVDNGGAFALVAAGLVQASSLTAISGGTLSGIGTFDTPTINVSGTVNPGNSPGILTMGTATTPTTVTFSSTGELVIEMQGDAVAGTDYDVLNVVGDVVFEPGAQLTLSYLNGYSPTPVTVWPDILTATGSVTGWENLALPPKYELSLAGGNLTLSLIPEPATLAVFGLAGLGLLRRQRRRA
ncbi:MAG: hypothetical protein BWZ02_01088 [Lentisphaerae bacterium ADurb.BinA184]|nr:MAG: hypothetical protein BWZ02_01088 [Lentisphaerae bacterium ADurb.BinA184]